MSKKIICLTIGMIIMTAFFIVGCRGSDKSEKGEKPNIVVAKMEKTTTKLYYKATLAPLQTIPVLSPVEGTVTKVSFKYGDFVQKDEELVSMDSPKLADDYRQAVTKYLQAKDTYEHTTQSMQGTEALHKAGVIPNDEYLTSKSQYSTDTLNFYLAKFELEKLLKIADIDPKTIENLSLVDTKAVNEILQRRFSHIVLRSPGLGVALFPVQNGGGDGGGDGDKGGKAGKLDVGSQIKEGQLILAVGDLTGLSATLQVTEININKIKLDLPVIVTGDAFPGITLKGTITSVANQANPDQGSGGGGGAFSVFNVTAQIPQVTEEQLKIIHVGMSANFEIDIENPPRIMLPIKAVFQNNGQSMVTIVDSKTGGTKDVPVTTGETTLTNVAILEGLHEGDQVVVHD